MFTKKRDRLDITRGAHVFSARYIGNIETSVAVGKGCTINPLQKLWERAPKEKDMKKMHIQITLCGIFLNGGKQRQRSRSLMNIHNLLTGSYERADEDFRHANTKRFGIEDISHCAADTTIDERIFCWIHRSQERGYLYLHAVLCSGKDIAQIMASVTSRAFRLAYSDWQFEKMKIIRRKFDVSLTAEDATNQNITSSLFYRHSAMQSQTQKRTNGTMATISSTSRDCVVNKDTMKALGKNNSEIDNAVALDRVTFLDEINTCMDKEVGDGAKDAEDNKDDDVRACVHLVNDINIDICDDGIDFNESENHALVDGSTKCERRFSDNQLDPSKPHDV